MNATLQATEENPSNIFAGAIVWLAKNLHEFTVGVTIHDER